MAKNGFKMIDAEMHVMEPVDLWQRYIDPEFAARAPRRLSERRWDIRTMVEGEVMAAIPGGDSPAQTAAEEKSLGDRYAEEIARDFDPQSQVRAMDKEGLDLAILFPTSAMYVTAFTRMDARFAAAACRRTTTGSMITSRRPTRSGCSAPPQCRRTTSRARSPKPAAR
jgi:uncharacterized protein